MSKQSIADMMLSIGCNPNLRQKTTLNKENESGMMKECLKQASPFQQSNTAVDLSQSSENAHEVIGRLKVPKTSYPLRAQYILVPVQPLLDYASLSSSGPFSSYRHSEAPRVIHVSNPNALIANQTQEPVSDEPV